MRTRASAAFSSWGSDLACFSISSKRVLIYQPYQTGNWSGAGQGRTLRPLPLRAVERDCSFRLENSFMRLSASFSEMTARRGRSHFRSLIDFSLLMTRDILLLIGNLVNVMFLATKREPDLAIGLTKIEWVRASPHESRVDYVKTLATHPRSHSRNPDDSSAGTTLYRPASNCNQLLRRDKN